MEKTLYVTDLDGTLLNNNGEISDFSAGVLNELIEKDVNFTIATARSSATVFEILSKIKLKLPIVLMNGVVVFDNNTKQYERVCYIPHQIMTEVLKMSKKHNVSGFLFALKNDILSTYYENLESEYKKSYIRERHERYKKSLSQVNSFFEINLDNVIYYSFCDKREVLKPFYDDLKKFKELRVEFYQDTYDKSVHFMEIFSVCASKKTAVEFLREKYKFDKIVCFGDNINDIPLFEGSDFRVAVANAKDELKKIAHAITDTNNEDGVVKYLTKLVKY